MENDFEEEKPKTNLVGGYSICFNEWALDKRIRTELPLLMIISSLSAETGYCFASNQYLAKLFNCTEISVSQKISKLKSLGYIEVDYEKRGFEVVKRYIRLKKFLTDDYKKIKSTIKKDFKYNNTSINNTRNNTKPLNPLKGDSCVRDSLLIFGKIVKYHTGIEPNTSRWESSLCRWLVKNNIQPSRCLGVIKEYYNILGSYDDEYMPKVRDLKEFYGKFYRLEDFFTNRC